MSTLISIFQIAILIYSAIIHEYMHGWMADREGDSTAKNSGRLTLNPIPHIDPIGSILVPFVLVLSGSPFLAWAKPVPVNPYNLRDKKYGGVKVAAAGPMANLVIAITFGLIFRVLWFGSGFEFVNDLMIILIGMVVYINIMLMIFNLIPIPPLDGSRILMPFLPYEWQIRMHRLERYGMIVIYLFVILAFQLIFPIVGVLFKLLTGISLGMLFGG